MRTIFHLISFGLLGIGAVVAAFGLLALGYAWVSPAQSPPSMNEGPGMAALAGLYFLVAGAFAFAIGLVISLVLKASRPPHEIVSTEWAREHRRLW